MGTVQNDQATVSNNEDMVDKTVNRVVGEATQRIFENVVRLERLEHIVEDFVALLTTEMKNASFMDVNLELEDEQREKLMEFSRRAATTARDKYLGALKKDERTKNIVQIVEDAQRKVVEQALSAIGQEVNRGAIISSIAVKADAKKEDYNSLELNYSKAAGDITIPTKGIFISTNCVQVIKDSCVVYNPDLKDVSPKGDTIVAAIGHDGVMRAVDPETGEVKDE